MTVIDHKQYTWDEIQQEMEFRRAVGDFINNTPSENLEAFINFCGWCKIRHPEKGRITFQPFDAQIETARSFLTNRAIIILKARQIGFSTLVALYALWLAAMHPDMLVVMLSRTERDAIKLLAKAKYALKALPPWIKHRLGPVSETQTKLEFSATGSVIESLPSSQPARGDSASLIIVDEIAFMPNGEEAWQAIEPAYDVGGRVIMLSTANGEGDLFHRLWSEAEVGANRFNPLFFPWSANGRTQEWYDAKAADTLEHTMAQEYPSNPEEAFLKSGRPVFDLERLRELELMPPLATGHFVEDPMTGAERFVADGEITAESWEQIAPNKGPEGITIWEWPDPRERYAIGADVAQGLEHGDYTAAHVIACRSGRLVATYHGKIDPDIFGRDLLPALGRYYSQALIGVESNAHGLTTLKYLDQAGYFPVYYERTEKQKGRAQPTKVLGFRTTQVTKPLIIDKLSKAIREGFWMPDKHTLAELKTFVRDGNGRMAGSPYDDRTMSLAIANHMRAFVFLEEYLPEEKPPPGSFGDWELRLYGTSFKDLTQPTGARGWGKRPDRPRIGKRYIKARNSAR